MDAPFTGIGDGLIVSRAIDNRSGAFVALETLRLLSVDRPFVNVVALAAAQEEISYAGAFTATFKTDPMVAIAIDVTHATDYPGADKKRNDEVALGSGPVLTRGSSSANPVVFERLVAAADCGGDLLHRSGLGACDLDRRRRDDPVGSRPGDGRRFDPHPVHAFAKRDDCRQRPGFLRAIAGGVYPPDRRRNRFSAIRFDATW